MKKRIAWSSWSIATKITVFFLGLAVLSMLVIGIFALVNIRSLGHYALETSTSLGERAIIDSTSHLNNLGEEMIKQKARDAAVQIEMYLDQHPFETTVEMHSDAGLRSIVVQPVGKTGYTTLIDPVNAAIIIHKFPEQEKDISHLKDTLPSFWELIQTSVNGVETSGYYDWLEIDGSIRQKYASIVPVKTAGGEVLTLWATTYIVEFSTPAEETKKEINNAIIESSEHIRDNVNQVEKVLILLFVVVVIVVVTLALILSKIITRPILSLKHGTEAISQGNLDHRLVVRSHDELGDLAESFNKMSAALKSYTEELRSTAAENIAKEKQIQDNLRLYAQKISEAQEAERKRIARDLHDGIVQALVVVARQLDDLTTNNSTLSVENVRKEVQNILKEVRRFSQELRPSVLDDLGLIPAVKWLATDLENNYNIKVETEITGEQPQLSEQIDLMLFRIIQEALTNIRKHSGATRAVIKIEHLTNKMIVTIRDNGKGFLMSGGGELTRHGKLGLVGIRERVDLLRGKLQIKSELGKGTALVIEIPL